MVLHTYHLVVDITLFIAEDLFTGNGRPERPELDPQRNGHQEAAAHELWVALPEYTVWWWQRQIGCFNPGFGSIEFVQARDACDG